jgi:uncharacterized protein (TIGR03790 family)
VKKHLLAAFVLAFLLFPIASFALEPNQLALIVNKNEPKGVELAELYAKARGVPDGRIITLDLPTGDELPADQYQAKVAEPVRQFLKQNNLDKQVTCLVTFYGVPLRVGGRVNTAQDTEELKSIITELRRVASVASPAVGDLEKLAVQHDASFRAAPGTTIEQLARRADQASKSLAIALQRISDAERRQSATAEVVRAMKRLSAPVPATDPSRAPSGAISTAPSSAPALLDPATEPTTQLTRAELDELAEHVDQPDARRKLRSFARRSGTFPYAQMLMMQAVMLNPDQSDAALDSELSMIAWGVYPRGGWQPNPMSIHAQAQRGIEPVLMVARLDGPTPELVRNMIETSIAIERDGLKGKIVIDSRGLPPRELDGKLSAYGAFDQLLRNLAALLKSKTQLTLVFDEKPDVIQPAAAVDEVAVYCGWYSVDKYVPGMKFTRGAVGMHIASFTMGGLRTAYAGDWARGLLSDGCVATVGAVSEPLLTAFPQPDEFIPLLLTGKLTLAEAYWRTTPMVSWKLSLIGDPLYTPYRTNPAIRAEDLPPQLSGALSGAK